MNAWEASLGLAISLCKRLAVWLARDSARRKTRVPIVLTRPAKLLIATHESARRPERNADIRAVLTGNRHRPSTLRPGSFLL